MNEEADELVLKIAKRFIEYASVLTSSWDEAFLRFEGDEEASQLSSIYRIGDRSSFFEADDDAEFDFTINIDKDFVSLQRLIQEISGKSFLVCLLRVDSNFDFNLYYEFENSEKWRISKRGGASGIPVI